MKKIGIIVAMDVEFRLVETMLSDKKVTDINHCHFVEGYVGGKEVVLLQSGIGKVLAAVGTMVMIRDFAPDCIVNTGVAGGIDPTLRVMDIVVGKEVVYHDVWCGEGNEYGQIQGMPARFIADRDMFTTAMASLTDVGIVGGLICTGDQFITARPALDAVKGHFPQGMAVDMESGAIAHVCHILEIPFLSFRIISDTPGQVKDHATQYKDFWTAAPGKSFEVLKQFIENI